VHHDPELAGLGVISAHTLAEIRRVALPNGEPVPVLEEVLAALGAFTVWVEVKTLPPEFDGRLLAMLAAGPGRYGVHAFDHRIIARLGRQAPALHRGVLSASRPVDPVAQVTAAGAAVLWQEASLTDADLVDVVHAAGKELIVWTANTPDELERLTRLGVDGLCGNYPDRSRAAVGLPPRP
ncbi:MAG: glycerophosphodiester phosphodiesterase, partial [Gemmatimonadales bacterium]